MFTRDPNRHPHPRPLLALAHATSTRESRPATFRHTHEPHIYDIYGIRQIDSVERNITFIHIKNRQSLPTRSD